MPDVRAIDPDATYTLREAITLDGLGTLGRERLRRAIADGELPATRDAAGWRVAGADLAGWLRARNAERPPVPPAFLTTSQAAIRAGVGVTVVHQAIAAGRLPATKVGGRWVIDPADLVSWRRGRG
jgi:excisionase family DNA binding protein